MREIVNEYGSFIIEAIILSVFIKGAILLLNYIIV